MIKKQVLKERTKRRIKKTNGFKNELDINKIEDGVQKGKSSKERGRNSLERVLPCYR